MKYYVTSDVHGYCSILKEALAKSGFFKEQEEHKLVILGDLFDRGHEAKELQDFIVELMEKDLVILIRGNHEDMFVEMVTEDGGYPYRHHVLNGTYDTALQLTGHGISMDVSENLQMALDARETAFYKKIIPAMLDFFETKSYVFVHGWLPCIREKSSYCYVSDWRKSSDSDWSAARWYNGIDAAQTAYENKTILCGHWHASYGHSKYENACSEFGDDADFTPYYGPRVIAIDACTARSGIVNVVVLED